jgi:hypothetical protein
MAGRWTGAALGAVLTTATIAGCGGDDTPSVEDLESFMLTEDDLPEGYSEGGFPMDSGSAPEECPFLGSETKTEVEATASFTYGLESVVEAILLPVDGAEQVIADITEAQRCPPATGEASGFEMTVTMAPLEVPELGDDAVGLELDVDLEGAGGRLAEPPQQHLVAMRHGDFVIVVFITQLGTIDPTFTEDVARRALDRASDL